MAEKITIMSANPAFLNFPEWAEKKIADLRTTSQFEQADQMQGVIDAKHAVEEAADWAVISAAGNVYTVSSASSPTTPEYEILWAEWQNEFDVSIFVEAA